MTPTAQILAEWYGSNPKAGELLAILYEARGRTLTYHDLCERLGVASSGLTANVKRLRKAVEPRAVINVEAVGYRLSAAAVDDCDAAMADARERAAA